MAAFAQLKSIDDPRDNLEKAHRPELVRFARANGLTHITEDMPAILIRHELRTRRLTNIRIPPRPLGAQQNHPDALAASPQPQNVVEVNAAADLARQYEQQLANQREPEPESIQRARPPKYPNRLKPRPPQEINQLRDECKRLGIKMERRDGKAQLKAKIEAHRGQNAAQRSQ